MLTNKRAVLFDLDGTLVDSMWMWKKIDIEYLGQYGYDVPEGLAVEIEGMSFSETAEYFKKRFQIPEPVESIKARWNEMAYDKYCHEVPLKAGAKNFLEYLKSNDIQTGIATSNSRELAEAVLDAHGITHMFDVILTSCDAKAGKPAPDVYLLAAKRVAVAPHQCLVFEDVPMGILAGKNAGMEVCAVSDEFSKHQESQKKKLADYYIQNYNEVLQRKDNYKL